MGTRYRVRKIWPSVHAYVPRYNGSLMHSFYKRSLLCIVKAVGATEQLRTAAPASIEKEPSD